ncbi:MAG: AAA family ATPase [Thermoplasmata archaeon]|nr:AAA family ATPase [Thermoplasmata archaeon]
MGRGPGRDSKMGEFTARHRVRSTALSGTPGTGKSSVAARLGPTRRVVEVAALAGGPSSARPGRPVVDVDLARLRAAESRKPSALRADVYVGHLAHFLPCRDVVLLRCHPLELADRLDKGLRGSRADRRENVAAEATDVILLEALSLRRRVWEVDTTDRSLDAVAREVRTLLDQRPPPRFGRIDWLADARVTDYLLRPNR